MNANLSTTLVEPEATLTESLLAKKVEEGHLKVKALLGIGNVNLTESSSSGSVTDSVCTAYEGNGSGEKPFLH